METGSIGQSNETLKQEIETTSPAITSLETTSPAITSPVIEDDYIYEDEDNDDDLDENPYNITWKNNKAIIKSTFINKGISENLVNYGKNIILFYKKKIDVVNKLMKSKQSDNKKNFVGDITIQDEQIKNINKLIKTDSSTKNVKKIDDMISSYYSQIGVESSKEVMKKDYDDRNKTIKYILLNKEYEENIQKVEDAILSYDETKNDTLNDDFIQDIGLNLNGGNNKIKNTIIKQKGGDGKEIVDDFSFIVKSIEFINNDIITNPLLTLEFITLLFKIQNSFINPLVVTQGYFNTSELKNIIYELKLKNIMLKGGNALKGGGALNDYIEAGITGKAVDSGLRSGIPYDIASQTVEELEESKIKILGVLEKYADTLTESKKGIFASFLSTINEKLKATQTSEQSAPAQTSVPTAPAQTSEQSAALSPSLKEESSSQQEGEAIDKDMQPVVDALDKAKEISSNLSTQFSNQAGNLIHQIENFEKEIVTIDNSIKSIEQKTAEIEKLSNDRIETIKNACLGCIDIYSSQVENFKKLLEYTKQKITETDEKTKELDKNITDLKTKELADLQIIKNKNLENHMLNEEYNAIANDLFNNIAVDTNYKTYSKSEMFIIKYIKSNYVKNNLYKFVKNCKNLDSVPQWRAMLSQLIVSYITSYVKDPNSDNYINVIPSYDYFNLVLMGTPGVGKSYTADIIGKALKCSGFLTIGDRKDIKKPDIVGSYTGQTAPKVYNELTQCLGKVIFIDEAYSIAGAKDKVKGTFNEFGQEALDAITDYTSEHIGLFGFIVAGYEYEMRTQFLNVNIGLPRRFPTVLTLQRYNMKSFWKILEGHIIKFCPKYQVNNHHKACFELLNLLFNFQCNPNPIIKLSTNWKKLWEGYNLINLLTNINFNMSITNENIISIPILQLLNFNEKIKNIIETPIDGEMVEILPYTTFFKKTNNVTATFIKAYSIYKFTGILNGDFFRSQADNLTKFGQIMLEDKIINPSGKFNFKEDNNKTGNLDWIQYVYFNLYFQKNPNKKINNIDFSFEDSIKHGGTYQNKKRTYTKKNNKNNKKTRVKKYKNKNTITKKYNKRNQNKRNQNKKTYKKFSVGGDGEKKRRRYDEDEPEVKANEPEVKANEPEVKANEVVQVTANKVDDNNEDLDTNADLPNEILKADEKDNLSKQKALQMQSEKNEQENMGAEDNLSKQKALQVQSENMGVKYENIKESSRQTHEQENMGAEDIKLPEESLRNIKKDIVFTITNRDFSDFRDIPKLIENIIYIKSQENENNNKKDENAKLPKLFENYLNSYDKYLKQYEENSFEQDENFAVFVYVYILLNCYYTANIESNKPEGPFDIESWWFFSKADFNVIKDELDFEFVLNKFDELVKPKKSKIEENPDESKEKSEEKSDEKPEEKP